MCEADIRVYRPAYTHARTHTHVTTAVTLAAHMLYNYKLFIFLYENSAKNARDIQIATANKKYILYTNNYNNKKATKTN